MWLKKEEYDKLKSIQDLYGQIVKSHKELLGINKELNDEQLAVKIKEAELTRLLLEARKLKNNMPLKYTIVQEPETDEHGKYDFRYYENITQILNNRYYQWFMYRFRENIISQVAYNMGVKANFFLVNNEEIAGGLKVIEHIIQEMERIKMDHNAIIEADKNAETNHEV